VKYGDIVLILHYSSDVRCIKYRPALVISSNKFNTQKTDRILVPLTSNTKYNTTTDIIVKSDERIFKATGLKHSSVIRVGKIFTADVSLIKRRLGCLSDKKMKRVCSVIKKILSLEQ